MRLSPIALAAVLTFTGTVLHAETAPEVVAAEAADAAIEAIQAVETDEAIDAVVAVETDQAIDAVVAVETDQAIDAVETDQAIDTTVDAVETAVEETTSATAEATETAAVPEAIEASQPPAAPAPAPAAATVLGPIGYDSAGRPGRVHVVASGDTLWDVSDAYLGTPWVWPSIWTDNESIANPHLIHPGDRIWITPTEMRKVTAEEADAMLASAPPETYAPAAEAPPASFSDAFSRMGNGPHNYRYTEIQTAGFVTSDVYEGAATILDSAVPRVWLGDHDEVHIGFGNNEVAIGDKFEIFRPMDRVVDPESGREIGWATQVLGWLEVTKVHDESATAVIRLSRSEIRRDDYLLPKPPVTAEISVAARPEVSGRIVHTPNWRTEMASTDVVYLDRGAADGLEVGSPLEVFRPMGSEFDEMRGEDRRLPDEVVAKLIVVQAAPEAAVAVVTHTRAELNRGDLFRGSDSIAP